MLVKEVFSLFEGFSEELLGIIAEFFEDPARLPKEFISDAKILRNEFNSYNKDLPVSEDAILGPEYLDWIASNIERDTPQLTVCQEIYNFRKLLKIENSVA